MMDSKVKSGIVILSLMSQVDLTNNILVNIAKLALVIHCLGYNHRIMKKIIILKRPKFAKIN